MDIDGQKHRMLHYPSGKATAPVYFDIHGGGFCWGMIEENDQFCLNVNQQLGIEVYELDYPLVPDAVFPTALNWLYETISYIVQNSDEFHIDSARMAVGGQSAGANLAAALTLMAKDRGEFQFACQVLDYPALDIGAGVVNEAERFFGEGAMPRQVLDLLYAAYATEWE